MTEDGLVFSPDPPHITPMTAETADPLLSDPIFRIRNQILAEALPDIAFDGWTDAVIAAACARISISDDDAIMALPDGAMDLIAHFSASGDAAMLAELEGVPRPDKIRQAIALAVKTRIQHRHDHREAVRRAVAALALPGRQRLAVSLSYATADAIWRWVGDTSTDYNFYSKRTILAGVITATRFYWLSDDSVEAEDSWAFLDRRIDNVMQFEKAKAASRPHIERGLSVAQEALKRLARWRYGRQGSQAASPE